MKADRSSKRLSVLQQASRHVNEMAANVVASTKTGQDNLEEKGKGVLSYYLLYHTDKSGIIKFSSDIKAKRQNGSDC